MSKVLNNLKKLTDDIVLSPGNELTQIEAIELALKIQRNQILENINEGLIDINSSLKQIRNCLNKDDSF